MKQNVRTGLIAGLTALLVSSIFGPVWHRNESRAETAVTPSAIMNSDVAGEESAVITTIEQSGPAVASVIISKDLPIMERYYEEVPGPFRIRIPRIRQNGTERQEVGGGTAFFVTSDGVMLTNKHVVSDEKASYTVLLNDGRTLEAKVASIDPTNDIALLKVDGSDFPVLSLSPTEARLGQTAVAIGNALGEFRNTVSVGVVSGLQRNITAGSMARGEQERLSRIIQTDAAINAGNSGGPLLDIHGRVIGMNTAVAAGAQNIGFAIPAHDLELVLQSFQQYGRIVRPYVGVRYAIITPEMQSELKLTSDKGAVVVEGDAQDPAIIPGSPAAKAGLQVGDIIVEIDGIAVTEEAPVADIIGTKAPGDSVSLKILRNGKEIDKTVVLEEWKDSPNQTRQVNIPTQQE